MSASAGRVMIIPKGTYDASVTYKLLDAVYYSGSTYICKAQTTGNAPTNTTYWQLMAQGTQSAQIAGNYYGTCDTAGATASKVVTVPASENFVLQVGDIVGVRFTNTNTANNPTINVNNSGAKPIYYNKSAVSTGTLWAGGEADRDTLFMYDGTNWVWIAHDVDLNTDNLVDLTDTNISSPSNGQALVYNGTTQKWENGSGGILPHLIIITETGESSVKAVKGQIEIIATETSTGHYECDVPEFGTWTIHAVLNGDDATVNLVVDTVKVYTVDDSHFHADITVTYPSGATCSCSKTGETTLYATGSPYTFTVHSSGTWTITCAKGGVTRTQTVNVSSSGQTFSVNMTPTGATVTPTDDVETLCVCAGIWDSTISTISDLLADSTSLLAVISSNNAIDYLVRSTTFASDICANSTAMTDIGLNNYASNTLLADSTWLNAICNSTYFESVLNVKVPTMTSATSPSGEVSASSYNSTQVPYKAFDNDSSTYWCPTSNEKPSKIWYQFVNSVKSLVTRFTFKRQQAGNTTINVKVIASNDGTNWTDLTSGEDVIFPNTYTTKDIVINPSINYKYYGLNFSGNALYVSGSYQCGIYEIQFYGRTDV